jgi:hypothetical protein
MSLIPTEDAHVVERATLHLNGQAWGVAFGVVGGVGLFIATIVLVLRGGPNVGSNLGLLAAFLPGYRVTVAGAFIGFIYLFVIGYALGRLIGVVYNRVSAPRSRA